MRATAVFVLAAGVLALAHAGTAAQTAGRELRGRVVLDDGSRPPRGLRVLSTCGNLSTARDGTFTFTGGYGGGRAEFLIPCYLVVSLSGFHTVRGRLPDKDNVRVVLHHVGSEGVPPTSVDAGLLQCSARTGQAYGNGQAAMGLRQWNTAEKWFRATVQECPEHASAWDELGLALEMQGRIEEARTAYEKSLEANPQFAKPLVHLAGLALAASQNEQAFEMSQRAVRLNPANLARAWFYHAMASFNTGRFEIAEKSAFRTSEEDKGRAFPLSEYLVGVLLARKGRSAEAAAHLRTFLELAPKDGYAENARRLLAEIRE